uniref:Si:ch73-237c6.1 n=1 Tax=Astyanax mexicanus TaxID=7994 RepID=W5KJX1_ASTMX
MKSLIFCKILLLVLHVQQAVSQSVQCFTDFSLTDGTCSDLLGDLPLEDCCMNPQYGFVERGACKSCRFAQWTEWSPWGRCSVNCLQGVRQRRRACYGIGKCQDFNQHGSIQTEPCEESSCCPENGGWSEWSPWLPCSVTCETGFTLRKRLCTEPPPKCGGTCIGPREERSGCDTGVVCPTHGGWSEWGSWGPCAGMCKHEGNSPPEQLRHRTCTNPPPSAVPPGNDCKGPITDTQLCHSLPFCPVNGSWGAWSEPSECSVTCGVGRQTQRRNCDSPAPKHGGLYCQGDDTTISLCNTNKHCPAHGHWSEWGEWGECQSTSSKENKCKKKLGQWRRVKNCLGKDHGGQACPGDRVEFGKCFNIKDCPMTGIWSGWSDWSFCKPDCGEHSVQKRVKTCVPDITGYSNADLSMFSGKPKIKCPLTNDTESRPCFNVPECS